MTHGSLFSGIGGFDLAADWMGWENKFHCEWNEFGQKVLKYYWPNAELFTDITKSDFTKYANQIDILTGGFPCQPYSMAGKRLGKEDDRHLWPEMLRVIREVKPSWVVGENVLGLVNWNEGLVFHEVQTDLEAEGYEVWPYVLPACSVNSPQKRDRVWFIAHSNKVARKSMGKRKNEVTQQWDEKIRCQDWNEFYLVLDRDIFKIRKTGEQEIICESPLISDLDGISLQLDRITFQNWVNQSNGAYGNAIVPQVVYQIFKAIEQYEHNQFSGSVSR
jgi:DNA (cytosine-5)-methyltransferase 1